MEFVMRNCLRAIALLVLLLFCSLPAMAGSCITRNDITETAKRRMPQARIAIFAGEEASRFLAAYNARPPRTGFAGDEVLIIDPGARAPTVLAVLFQGGCAKAGGRISRDLFESILTQLARGEA
jgi:hypothetical protein